jgi:hypothetical protein
MRRIILWLLTAVLLAHTPLLAQAPAKPDAGFTRFLEQFRAAVEQRNEKKLTKMMAPSFDFFRATGVAPAKVFQGLAADGGRQWANLEDALLHREEADKGGKRVLQCTPVDVASYCYVVFEQDGQRRWRWQGMIMPPRE